MQIFSVRKKIKENSINARKWIPIKRGGFSGSRSSRVLKVPYHIEFSKS